MELVKACVNCKVFKWSGNYYKQLRGLAMGQRLAPILAISFMSKVEKPVIERMPMLYCRYIDDCFIVTSTQVEMDECFNLMNRQSRHIRLTRETPSQDWLPFLNSRVRQGGSEFDIKWYRKPTCKNILVHARSAHPTSVKKAVVKNMFRTARELSSGATERDESTALAKQIASSNGYVEQMFSHQQHRIGFAPDKVVFCIPFVSDEVSRSIRDCLKRANLDNQVTLVESPPDNLRKRLVRNRMYDRIC